jgi:hypothetical protein
VVVYSCLIWKLKCFNFLLCTILYFCLLLAFLAEMLFDEIEFFSFLVCFFVLLSLNKYGIVLLDTHLLGCFYYSFVFFHFSGFHWTLRRRVTRSFGLLPFCYNKKSVGELDPKVH